jgi:hypothetical protein
MILIPRRGRDYKSKKEVLDAWENNHDFETADIMSGYGQVTSRQDLEEMGQARGIQFRYSKLEKTFYLP